MARGAIVLALACFAAWVGNALYALGAPGGMLKHWSPALVALGFTVFLIAHGGARYGGRAMLALMGIVCVVGWGFETLSMATGLPFGHYRYTDLMAPFIGAVPVFVLPAYLFMGYASWSLAALLYGSAGARPTRRAVSRLPMIAAGLMVLWDLNMDPLRAGVEGRWIWQDAGPWFGVPITNFIGWFVVTWCMFTLFAAVLLRLPARARLDHEGAAMRFAPPVIYASFAAEYLLNPFTGHGNTLTAAGARGWSVQDIYAAVAVFCALSFGLVLWLGLRAARCKAQKQSPRAAALRS